MYTRSMGCPFVEAAKRVLKAHQIAYREVFVDQDIEARQRLLQWTGFLSVPTLVVARPGTVLPYTEMLPLQRGYSPRGIDRGPVLTEGSSQQVEMWLHKHGFIQ